MKKEIAIIGAGLTGSLLAIYLAKRGHRVKLFEKRADLRGQKSYSGRSINLALSARGMHALEQVDLLDKILSYAVPVYGRKMHSVDGQISCQAYGRDNNEHNYAISRSALNIALLNELDGFDTVNCYFEHQLQDYFPEAQKLIFSTVNGTQQTFHVDYVFGADGAFSKLREILSQKSDCQYQLVEEPYGYKELLVSAELGASLNDKHLHIWPRNSFMLMSLPNPNNSHTLTLYMPHKGDISFELMQTDEELKNFFKQYFSDVPQMLPDLQQQFFEHQSNNLLYVNVENYYLDGKALLIGDAAHAMVPFLGQGMNCGFEDVRLLCQQIDEKGLDFPTLFQDFYSSRKPDTDAIIQMALENYHEMRDAVGTQTFLFQKAVEQEIMQRYPEAYISKYVLISYTHTPYAKALQEGLRQKTLLQQLTAGKTKLSEIDWHNVDTHLKC